MKIRLLSDRTIDHHNEIRIFSQQAVVSAYLTSLCAGLSGYLLAGWLFSIFATLTALGLMYFIVLVVQVSMHHIALHQQETIKRAMDQAKLGQKST